MNANLFLLRREGSRNEMPSDLSGLTYCTYLFEGSLHINSSAEKDIQAAMKRVLRHKADANPRE